MENTDITHSGKYFLRGALRDGLLDEMARCFIFEPPVCSFINTDVLNQPGRMEAERCVIERLAPTMVCFDNTYARNDAPLTLLRQARRSIKKKVYSVNAKMRRTRMNELVALVRIAKLDYWHASLQSLSQLGEASTGLEAGYIEEVSQWMKLQCERAAMIELDPPALQAPDCVHPDLHASCAALGDMLVGRNKGMRRWLKDFLRAH